MDLFNVVSNKKVLSFITCDWIYGNHSKLRIKSYKIIDFKDFNAL